MLICKKLRRQHAGSEAHRHPAGGYVHPERASRDEGLFVSAARATAAVDEAGNDYTAYVLRCSYVENGGRVSWEVKRRYNDFSTLHTKLRRYGAVIAELPSRSPFAKMSSVVRSRELGLQEYLQAVLNHCNDKQCSYLTKFLQVQKNLPSYQERLQTTAEAKYAGAPCHPAHSVGADGEPERGRSPASLGGEENHARATSVPHERRTRNKLDGVPRSSLHAQDDSSADFSRFLQGQTHPNSDGETSDEEVAAYVAWEEGRQRRQARVAAVVECGECGVCAESDGEGAQHHASERVQIGQSTARQQLKILEQLRLKREHQSGATNGSERASGGSGAVDGESEMAELAGIGLFFVQLEEGGRTVVDEIVGGGAAEASGRITAGDVLLCVDEESVEGLDLTDIRRLIVGRPGTGVTLHFSRGLPSTRRLHFGLVDSSDEAAVSGEESVMAVRRRHRLSVERESSADDSSLETFFVVRLVRAVQLSAHVASEEGPSPADHPAAAAGKFALTLATGPCDAEAAGQSRGRQAQGSRKAEAAGHERTGGSCGRKPEPDGEADAASNSSARSLSHRSTDIANLSGNSSGDDECGPGGGSSAPVTPKMPEKPATVEEVCAFLNEIQLGEYEGVFFKNKIDGDMLQDLQEHDLEIDFGITNKYHRRRLLSKRAACARAKPLAGPLSAASAASAASTALAPHSS